MSSSIAAVIIQDINDLAHFLLQEDCLYACSSAQNLDIVEPSKFYRELEPFKRKIKSKNCAKAKLTNVHTRDQTYDQIHDLTK